MPTFANTEILTGDIIMKSKAFDIQPWKLLNTVKKIGYPDIILSDDGSFPAQATEVWVVPCGAKWSLITS